MQLFNQTDASGKSYQCEGIRYFWGFDASRQNKIRLVLIGVRPDGSNLVHYDGGEDALMLEKEWPPDVVIGGDSLSVPHH